MFTTVKEWVLHMDYINDMQFIMHYKLEQTQFTQNVANMDRIPDVQWTQNKNNGSLPFD